MNGPVFSVIFWVGLAASVFSLGLIGLTVFLWARDVWVTHRIHRMSEIRRMDRLRELGDRERARDEEWGPFAGTREDIAALPIANPWSVM